MHSSTITTAAAGNAPDQTATAQQLIELGLALDPRAQSVTLARLIAGSLHPGHGSALHDFAATGTLDAARALSELNGVRVPLEREPWLDALGIHIITSGDRS